MSVTRSTPPPAGVGIGEIPQGAIDGANAVFTLLVPPVPAVAMLFHGVGATGKGQLLLPGVHYKLSGRTITFVGAYIPAAGDWLLIWYRF